MAMAQSNLYPDIKRVLVWERKIADNSFEMGIFCTEQEILLLIYHMSHVVVGTISSFTDIDIPGSSDEFVTVYNITKSAKFVFIMYGLNQGSRVSIGIQIPKMYSVAYYRHL